MSGAIPTGEQAELDRLRVIARRLGVADSVRLLSPWTPLEGAAAESATGAADLLLRYSRVPVLGVTGSAGKTTTARLAEAMLLASRIETLASSDAPAENAWPTAELLERALAARPPAWCIAELTSNHLAVCSASPQIACITNVWADHVDQHGSFASYLEAKRRIVAFQGTDDWTIVNDDDAGAVEIAATSPARVLRCTLRGPASDPGAGLESGRLTSGSAAGSPTSDRAAPCPRRRRRRRDSWPAPARCSPARPRTRSRARLQAGAASRCDASASARSTAARSFATPWRRRRQRQPRGSRSTSPAPSC